MRSLRFRRWAGIRLDRCLLIFLAALVAGCLGQPEPPAPTRLPAAADPPQEQSPVVGATSSPTGTPALPAVPTVRSSGELVAASPTLPPTPTPTEEPAPTARPEPPAVPVSPEEVVRGDPSRPWLSLVFNSGAGFRPAPEILDVLRTKDVRTTFFLMGWWAEQEPELVRRMAAEGHEIASHGYRVFDLTQVADAEVIADLERADAAIAALTGRSTRPLWSPSAGYRDGRVRRLAASLGYRPIYWTVDSGDWREEATAAGVRRRVLAEAVNGAIIVMHFDSPRSADTVAGSLPGIIDSLRADGYRLITVSELITGHAGGKDNG